MADVLGWPVKYALAYGEWSSWVPICQLWFLPVSGGLAGVIR